MRRNLLMFVLVGLLGLPAFATETAVPIEGTTEAARARMEEMNAARRSASRDQELVATGYTLAEETTAELVLLSHFAEPIEVSVEALGIPAGRLPLGSLRVEPRVPVYFDLNEALPPGVGAFTEGSLRVRFFGDPQMLSGWIVHRHGKETFEISLVNREDQAGVRFHTFWDARPVSGASPVYFLHNADNVPLVAQISEDRHSAGPAQILPMAPGTTRTWRPTGETGSLQIEHDGSPGALVVSGRLESPEGTVALPIWPAESLGEIRFESLLVPLQDYEGRHFQPLVSILDARRDGAPQALTLDLLDPTSGASFLTHTETVQPGEILTVEPRALLEESLHRPMPFEIRIRARASEPGLLLWGAAFGEDGTVRDLPFAGVAQGHPSGQYPLPSLVGRSVATTLVNVGDEPTEILAHVVWDGGEYALAPFSLRPGQTRRIDWAQVALQGTPDVLGRTLELDYEQGYLQWLSRPTGAVVARTEVLENGSADAYGFNCATCCPQSPAGELVPDSIHFAVGANPLFQTCVVYYTCTGQTGPFPRTGATLYYNAPFSWDGTRISASNSGEGVPEFELIDESIDFSCVSRPALVQDEGDATALDVSITKVDLPNDTISVKLEPIVSAHSGQLVIKLQNPANTSFTRAIFEGVKASGTYHFSFGNLDLYPDNAIYREVLAEWTVGSQTVSTGYPFYLQVLGDYEQSCYNTPLESDFQPPEVVVGTATNSCEWGSRSFFASFAAAVNLNGSGIASSGNGVSLEAFCSNPPASSPIFCSTIGEFSDCNRFRYPATIRTQCSVAPTANRTVARARLNSLLDCGDVVYINGIGKRFVEDRGELRSAFQLDHYKGSGSSACAGWGDSLRKTFKLNP